MEREPEVIGLAPMIIISLMLSAMAARQAQRQAAF